MLSMADVHDCCLGEWQVTLSMTPDHWLCINVGITQLDGLAKDLSMVS